MNRTVYIRRRIAALVALMAGAGLVALVAIATGATSSTDDPPGDIRFMFDGRTIGTVAPASFELDQTGERTRFRRVILNQIPRSRSIRRNRARIVHSLDRSRAVSEAFRLASAGGTVLIESRAVEATVSAPVVKQQLRNNCEATALEILLASRGVRSDQLTLQNQLRRDGPLDPRGDGAEMVWGDPDFGFVGRPDGGGKAGGFGVYPGPVASLASRYEMKLKDLTRRPPRDVYRRLLAGEAVMVWVGLADGPYGRWRSPRGADVEVNLNEHTVVLNGIDRRGSLSVVDPLSGSRQTWTKPKFESMWRLLGRRALST